MLKLLVRSVVLVSIFELYHGFLSIHRPSSKYQLSKICSSASSVGDTGGEILANGDKELSCSLSALTRKDIDQATRLLERAKESYARDGILTDREEFLNAVAVNIATAEAASRVNSNAMAAPQVDPEVYEKVRIEGDKLMMAATQAHASKNFEGALYNIQSAREVFSSLNDGGNLARDRESVLGNLYSVVLSDIQRQAHMEKLKRIKKLGELVKLKSKAKLYGIDLEELEDLDELGNPILNPAVDSSSDM